MFTGSCSPDSASATIPAIEVVDVAEASGSALPSPNTVSGLPASAWRTKVGIARPSWARMRGPYVLKMRTIAVSTPCWRW